ncbi:hypothetical protein VFPFJ_11138 [Purpureocillium lilacinum]|uniref:Uncharacterized protein n=1 Tax=Purpureocillium lilacinum TaxID=33203 RepID=A0A179FR97_PURLI|nr:hypothetical protein VFPFJ_11138 [Purpureocillium lilacinum]OAQ67549.1 hypothetical protein VFPFJ_11138 [Purpureocillium lilacinum]
MLRNGKVWRADETRRGSARSMRWPDPSRLRPSPVPEDARIGDKTHSNCHGYREERSLLTGMIRKSNRPISAFEFSAFESGRIPGRRSAPQSTAEETDALIDRNVDRRGTCSSNVDGKRLPMTPHASCFQRHKTCGGTSRVHGGCAA